MGGYKGSPTIMGSHTIRGGYTIMGGYRSVKDDPKCKVACKTTTKDNCR